MILDPDAWPEPSSEQCDRRAPITRGKVTGYACWLPQLGGYTAHGIIITEGGEHCCDVLSWSPLATCDRCADSHDGPHVFHVCDWEQWRDFANWALGLAADDYAG